MLFGTPEYMSPGAPVATRPIHRVDVYAMGCILFQLITTRVPFEAENFMGVLSLHLTEPPPQISDETFDAVGAPRELGAIIDKALMKDRNARYQTMDELRERGARRVGRRAGRAARHDRAAGGARDRGHPGAGRDHDAAPRTQLDRRPEGPRGAGRRAARRHAAAPQVEDAARHRRGDHRRGRRDHGGRDAERRARRQHAHAARSRDREQRTGRWAAFRRRSRSTRA